MSKISKISILIPCYNEEKTIRQVIINVEKSLVNINIDYEIIVVDDYSNDGSSKKLTELQNEKKIKLFTHSQNQGKGAAIATGLKNINGEIILIQGCWPIGAYGPDRKGFLVSGIFGLGRFYYFRLGLVFLFRVCGTGSARPRAGKGLKWPKVLPERVKVFSFRALDT